jgi:hypothetical protein
MDEYEAPIVITAISDPEFEGLVSSALYSQGWSVVARALDIAELHRSLESHSGRKLLIIYSTDLPGLNRIDLAEITRDQVAIFGFSDGSDDNRGFPNISPRPKSPEELLLVILENARTPTGRAPLIHIPINFSSKINAVGGVRHSTGNTTFAINLAQEFALLESRTLLIDANFQAPALASLLDLRHLATEAKWREVSQNLYAIELTQQNIENFDLLIREAGECFDQIVIDLGSVSHLVKDLTDRRWISRLKIWASRNADHFFLTSTSELLSQKSLDEFMQSASNLTFGSKLHLIKWQQSLKNQSSQKSIDKSPSPLGINWHLTWDQRACQAAIAERTTLAQVSERSSLRKEILAIAQGFVSKTAK